VPLTVARHDDKRPERLQREKKLDVGDHGLKKAALRGAVLLICGTARNIKLGAVKILIGIRR
jgi:hypothetical protein